MSRIGKCLLLMTAVIAILAFVPQKTLAAEQGACGSRAYYSLDDDGNLSISGKGRITIESFKNRPDIKTVVIKNGITEIGGIAFKGCSNLASVTISDGVTSIEGDAFKDCRSLTSIVIPDSVTSIGDSAFSGCSALTSIIIPDSVTSMGHDVFYDCTCLESISLPFSSWSQLDRQFPSALKKVEITSGTSIASSAFYLCSGLTNIIISNGITSIEWNAFSGCSSLTSVTIPESVTSIGSYAFSDCSSLTSIVIPDGVTSIDDYTFYGCSSLTGITIPDSVTSIGELAFQGCSGLKSISIPRNVTNIGSFAFSGCSGLTSLTIPGNVVSIGSYAFQNCRSLKSVTIPNSVTSIGLGAFGLCSSLTNVTIPNSVQTIGQSIFGGCDSLKKITIPFVGDTWEGVNSKQFTYIIGSLAPESLKKIVVRGGSIIDDYAFFRCNYVTSILIPDSVTSIGEKAFGECSSLESITIPGSVTSVKENAFSGCSSLRSVIIPESVTEVGKGVFTDCTELKTAGPTNGNYDIRFGWTNEIPAEAFYGSALTTVTIPQGITTINNYAFKECPVLEEVYLPMSVETIDPEAFLGSKATIHCVPDYKYYGSNLGGELTWVADITDDGPAIEPLPAEPGTGNAVETAKRVFDTIKTEKPEKTTDFGENKQAVRSDGPTRFDTAIETANDLKIALGVEEFDTIIVASSHNFPDALAGSYLAAKKKAPIIIVRTDKKTEGVDKAMAFIRDNLADGGTVYILGGTSAVSAAAESDIRAVAGTVKRLAGDDRYATNLLILKEAGVASGDDLLIADGKGFADALSASALGKPILLINKKNGHLSDEQKAFLNGKSFANIYILGGNSAVPESIKEDLQSAFPGVSIERIAGATRYETSARIAEKFFPNPAAVTLATGVNFPDGLTGGSLAYALGAPLVLTRNKDADVKTAADYVSKAGADKFVVFGGESALPSNVVATVAGK